MASELETKIMNEIDLGMNYTWYNGSGDCKHIRQQAIYCLGGVLEENNLTISKEWLNLLWEADTVDNLISGIYTLTNVWLATSLTIQDALYRGNGGKGLEPKFEWIFMSEDKKNKWYQRKSNIGRKGYFYDNNEGRYEY